MCLCETPNQQNKSTSLSHSLSLSLNLSDDICQVDRLLKVAHHHEVPGLVPAVVEGVVVNMTEDGTSTDPRETAKVYTRHIYM